MLRRVDGGTSTLLFFMNQTKRKKKTLMGMSLRLRNQAQGRGDMLGTGNSQRSIR